MTRRSALAIAGGILGAAATPGIAAAFVQTVGPRATHIVISKSNRVLEMRAGAGVIKRYRIDLGFTPEGPKYRSGDGRTPEGRYWVDKRNPRSEYFLSIGINYPNAEDIARARALGVDPGGNIFIHGAPMRAATPRRRDWTAGCVAISNPEIEEVWAMTPLGVPVTILA